MTAEINRQVALPQQPFFEDVNVGDEITPLTKPPVTQVQLARYAGASGDFNPLHIDPSVGQSLGIGGTIAHGMLIMGFLGNLISDYLGGPMNLKHYQVRFLAMTRPGDEITCIGKITRKFEENGEGFIEAEVLASDAKGEKKASGTFTAALPRRS